MNSFVTGRVSTALSAELSRWLDEVADGLDEGTLDPGSVLPMLAKADFHMSESLRISEVPRGT
jgi:hypothetical protein